MKKIIKAGICVAAAAVIATGCGNKSQDAASSSASTEQTTAAATETETVSEEELHDEESVTLGDYKNLTFSAKEEEVTDAQVETKLKELSRDVRLRKEIPQISTTPERRTALHLITEQRKVMI